MAESSEIVEQLQERVEQLERQAENIRTILIGGAILLFCLLVFPQLALLALFGVMVIGGVWLLLYLMQAVGGMLSSAPSDSQARRKP